MRRMRTDAPKIKASSPTGYEGSGVKSSGGEYAAGPGKPAKLKFRDAFKRGLESGAERRARNPVYQTEPEFDPSRYGAPPYDPTSNTGRKRR